MFSISCIWPMSACFPGDKEMMAKVEDKCKKLLDSDEYSIVMKHIKKVCITVVYCNTICGTVLINA